MTQSTPEAISVVIPAYNYGQYLEETIRSVLAQSHSELECIVVDDGSTDNTADVVRSIKDPRIRYLPKPNGGLSSARNWGIREAKHRLIAFLDADDRWLPRFLERVNGVFATLDPQYGAVATAAYRMDENGQRSESAPFSFGHTGELTFRDFCLRNKPLSTSIVLRREALNDCGVFDESLRSSEDRDYWLRLTARGWKFHFLDEPLAEIRRHSANMSKAAARMQSNRSLVLRRARRSGVIPACSPFWLKVQCGHLLHTARAFHTQGNTGRALLLLAASWIVWPWVASPGQFSERPFFRARAFARFVLDRLGGRGS